MTNPAESEATEQVNGEAGAATEHGAKEMEIAAEQQQEEGKKSEEEKKPEDEKKPEEEQKSEDKKPEEKVQEQTKKDEPVQLGPVLFTSGVDMFMYFYDLLHGWKEGLDFNEYEQMVLSDLLTKGHTDPASKIGPGIRSFQVKTHPKWRSRCFYLVRTDGTSEDFSYRKCVDKLMTLPPDFTAHSGSGPGKGGGRHYGGRGGGGRGRGRGRRGRC